jgi:hypothetical protein
MNPLAVHQYSGWRILSESPPQSTWALPFFSTQTRQLAETAVHEREPCQYASALVETQSPAFRRGNGSPQRRNFTWREKRPRLLQ